MFSTLGKIKFTPLKGFNSFQGKRSSSLAEHALIEGKPRLQKTGDKLEELSIGMNFHTTFCEPEQEIDALHSAMEAGEILPLVWGNGKVAGYFVIADVDRNILKTTADGSVVSAAVTVSLKEHGQPITLAALQITALAKAFAFDEIKPLPLRSIPYAGGPDLQVMKEIETATTANEEIKSGLTRLEQGTTAAIEVGRRMERSALKIQQAMNNVQEIVQNTEVLLAQASALPLRAQQLADAALSLQLLMPPTDIGAIGTAAGNINNGLGAVKSSATPVATFNAIRQVID